MFLTFYWIVWLITMLSINLRFVLSTVWSRCFWASQNLWWFLTSTECTICCNSMQLMNSQWNTIHVLNVLTFYWIVWLITMLSINLRFVLSTVWSRCFWASQILWWILTSTECTICCRSMHLLNYQMNTIHVWNVFNVLLNGQTYYNALNEPLKLVIKCLK